MLRKYLEKKACGAEDGWKHGWKVALVFVLWTEAVLRIPQQDLLRIALLVPCARMMPKALSHSWLTHRTGSHPCLLKHPCVCLEDDVRARRREEFYSSIVARSMNPNQLPNATRDPVAYSMKM